MNACWCCRSWEQTWPPGVQAHSQPQLSSLQPGPLLATAGQGSDTVQQLRQDSGEDGAGHQTSAAELQDGFSCHAAAGC